MCSVRALSYQLPGQVPTPQAKIAFDTAGTKTFVLRYAHFRLL